MRRSLHPALLVATLICTIVILRSAAPRIQNGVWESRGAMPQPRSGAAAAPLPDGRMLIAGGTGADGVLASADLYGEFGVFAAAASMTVARTNHTSTLLQDGRVLVTGGTGADGEPLDNAEIYESQTDSWYVVASDMIDARSGHRAVRLQDGRVLLMGGAGASGPMDTLEVFDPRTEAFSAISARLSSPRSDGAAALLADGKVIVAAGSDGTHALSTVDLYDPTTDSVTSVGSLASPRRGLSATTLNDGRVLIVGGSDDSTDLASAEIYDPTARTFSPVAAGLAAAREGHLAFLLPHNGSVLIVGGSSAGQDLSSAELFLPWNGAFQSTGSLATVRHGAAGSPLDEAGTLLVAGGSGSAGSELYGFACVMTDSDDYGPGETAWISGRGFDPNEEVTLEIDHITGGIESGAGHDAWTVTTDAEGDFTSTWYVDPDDSIGSLFKLTAEGADGLHAETIFKDNPKVGSVVVGAQTPATIRSSVSATYVVTVGRGSGSGAFTATLSLTSTLPAGATASFSPNPVSFTSSATTRTATLTIATTPATPGGVAPFTVKAATSANDFAMGDGSLVIDNDGPETTIGSHPNQPANSASASFTFTGTDDFTSSSSLSFECEIDGGGFSTCLSPKAYAGLSNASHTFRVRSKDEAGNVDASPASFTWTVDTIAPTAPSVPDLTSASDSGSSSADNITKTAAPTFAGTAEAGSTVKIFGGGLEIGSGVATGGVYSITTSMLAEGARSVTATATDAAGNTSAGSGSLSVTIDTTPPTIAAHAIVVQEATSAAGAVVTYTNPATSDTVDGAGVATCVPASGGTFALGDTSVACNATDVAGNAGGSTSFTVRVNDTTAPTIAAHGDLIAEATSAAGAVVTYVSPATFDAVDGAGVASCSPASGSTFALGETTVTCHAMDAAGNTASTTTFVVKAQDTTAPVIAHAASAIVTKEATSAAGAVVTYVSPSTSDAVDGTGVASCSPPSGSTFPLGETTVTCHASDVAGNAALSTSFIVKVQDTTAPVIAAHVDMIEEATSAAGAVVSYTSPATSDAVDGSGIASCSPAAGTTFALGQTPVTCHATDAAGNASLATSFTVKVQDTTAPVIAAHVDMIEEATSAAGAVVSYTSPATSDAVDGSGIASCSPSAGTTFALGQTPVTCHATDAAGNASLATSFSVKVQDTTAPVIAVHVDMIEEATSAAGAVVTYVSPSTSDAVDGSGIASCSPASGTTFALGQTPVTCHATDAAGNASLATSFTVKVQDTTAPVIAAHADLIEEATSASGAVVTFVSPSTSDAVDGSGIASCSPASGTTFALGQTPVTCHATDAAGNASLATSFSVKVQDTTAPVIAAHADLIEEATSAAGAVVSYTSPATSDAVDGSGIASCSPASGTTFALGETLVTCHATDAAGNASLATSFTLRVQDTTAPVIAAHVAMIEEATSAAGAVVSYTSPATSDAVDGSGIAACSPTSGSTFAPGETTVTCHASDAAGNAALSTSFIIGVQDTTAPLIAAHADMIEEATSAAGAVVTYVSPSTSDAVDGSGIASCSPASGTTFAVGQTPVSCHATDAAGNASLATSFTVKVQDTTAPVIAVHADLIEEATSAAGAVVSYTSPASSDAVDGSGIATCSPTSGSTFALGETTVTCHASDTAGNTALSTSFTVKVQDTTAPVIAAHAAMIEEATSAAGAVVTFVSPSTSDAVDGSGIATCSPTSGSTFALGETTVTCHASDTAGNTALSTSFTVKVQDTTEPVIAAHVDVLEEATSAAGAVVSYTSPATSDWVDGSGLAICSPTSGSTFALGETTVTCHASDAAGNTALSASFTVRVQDTTPPTATPEGYAVNEDETLHTSAPGVLANDTDFFALTTVPAGGTSNGLLALLADGAFSYVPSVNFNGTDSFTYRARDASQNESTAATVTITVRPVNDPPAFTMGASPTVTEDSGPQSMAWATAISAGPSNEAGQALSFIVSNDNGALFSVQPTIAPDGTLSFTPAANANGSATVTVELRDDGGTANDGVDRTAAETFTVNILASNDAPRFTKGANQVVLEDAAQQTVGLWATGIISGPANESSQAVDFVVTNDNNALFSVQPAVSSAGTLTFKPAPNQNGAATVTVRAHDNGGTANGGVDTSVAQTFTIAVTAVNDAPSFVKGPGLSVARDAGPQTVNGWATSIVTGPANESSQGLTFVVTNDNNGLFAAQPKISPNGTLTYTPAATSSGPAWATVSVQLRDNGGIANGGVDASATQTFTIYATYAFIGFLRPVDNLPTINRVNSGAAVPVKFSLAGNQGLDILAVGYPASVKVNCETGNLVDDIEVTETAGSSSLTYDPTADQYKYVWKTEKAWANTCRQLVVRFKDGTADRVVAFKFK